MPDPKIQDAGQQVRLAITLCDRLELRDALAKSRQLLARSEELGELVRRAQVEARQRRGAGLARLVNGPGPVALSDVVEVVAATDPWLDADIEQGRQATAIDLAMTAARQCRGHALAIAVAEGPGLYKRLQGLALGCVETTAALPALPRELWQTPDPAGDAMRRGLEKAWATMVRAQDRFALVHQLAGLVRSMGGLGAQALLPDGAPDWGYCYKRWDRALNAEQELRRLHSALRLRYAVDQGWQPGLWLAQDLVKPPPDPGARRGLMGLLIPSPLRKPGEVVEVG